MPNPALTVRLRRCADDPRGWSIPHLLREAADKLDQEQCIERCMPSMSLRDYFAAHALQGILASSVSSMKDDLPGRWNAAEWAFVYADAMLYQREKIGGGE